MHIREIAKRAGVSHSTVSRVINNVDTVDSKLARRVRKVIEESGYRPNYQARALARGRSHTVGLIVSELSGGNPFFSEIILYFERAAVEHGYEVLISFADTETNPKDVAACLKRMQQRQVEGIAVMTFGMEQHIKECSIDLPLVYTGPAQDFARSRQIRINYLAGMREALNHLVEFGHKRIGYISGRLSWSSMQARYDALRKAMKAAGVALDKGLVVEGAHTWEGGALGMEMLLNLPHPPTAVMCCNDVAAIGAMSMLARRSMQAGKDIALVGLDDLTICRFVRPPLSTIHFSPRELAELAFKALFEEIQETGTKQVYEYKTHFVPRESTCAPQT